MTDQRAEEIVKIDVSQEESADKDDRKTPEEEKIPDTRPLDKLTKTELMKMTKELKEKSEMDYDRFLRAQAECDNIIKRNKKEKEEWIKYSNETLIKELLPVIDNLERAVSHVTDANSVDALREGLELILKGLKDALAKSGLEEIKAAGKHFDPYLHHAVSTREDAEVEAGIVLDELQKGYTLNKRLIRPAMVILSKGGSGGEKDYKEDINNSVYEN
ncbi:MAG TPA: nucleotide exchange factor GrpE [Desulfatiglandales bacterium]|nr:nucleotide exchange factor GrpE [Desulfatiglandales bacterium]